MIDNIENCENSPRKNRILVRDLNKYWKSKTCFTPKNTLNLSNPLSNVSRVVRMCSRVTTILFFSSIWLRAFASAAWKKFMHVYNWIDNWKVSVLLRFFSFTVPALSYNFLVQFFHALFLRVFPVGHIRNILDLERRSTRNWLVISMAKQTTTYTTHVYTMYLNWGFTDVVSLTKWSRWIRPSLFLHPL